MATELEKAKAAYPKATPAVKKSLEEIFGAEHFFPKIQEQVKSFEDAHLIFMAMKFKDKFYILLQKRKVADLSSFDKLLIICRALQGKWWANWADTTQKKWYPWFEYNKAKVGFGFSSTSYAIDCSRTHVGSRLCLPTDELATYFGSHPAFLKLHNEYLIINQ